MKLNQERGNRTAQMRCDWPSVLRRAALTLALTAATASALAQRPGMPPPPLGVPPPGLGLPPISVDPREDDSRLAARMRKERNIMRQKKLESQMRLLQRLTNELRADSENADQDTVAVNVAKKSEQIEKVARSIKELMIGPLS